MMDRIFSYPSIIPNLVRFIYPLPKEKNIRIQRKVLGASARVKPPALRDADSISFFEYNLSFYLKRSGEEKTKDKIRLMFKRASQRAQKEILNLDISPHLKELIQRSISL